MSVLLLAGNALLAQDSSHQTQIRDIYDTALTSGKSYAWLEHLSNQIGGRLSGSLEAERAVSWGEEELKALDWNAFFSYRKAVLADEFDSGINSLREVIGKEPTYITYINIKTKSGMVKTDLDPQVIREFRLFQKADQDAFDLGFQILIASCFFASMGMLQSDRLLLTW